MKTLRSTGLFQKDFHQFFAVFGYVGSIFSRSHRQSIAGTDGCAQSASDTALQIDSDDVLVWRYGSHRATVFSTQQAADALSMIEADFVAGIGYCIGSSQVFHTLQVGATAAATITD
jgi:hypothetical protein